MVSLCSESTIPRPVVAVTRKSYSHQSFVNQYHKSQANLEEADQKKSRPTVMAQLFPDLKRIEKCQMKMTVWHTFVHWLVSTASLARLVKLLHRKRLPVSFHATLKQSTHVIIRMFIATVNMLTESLLQENIFNMWLNSSPNHCN